MNVIVLHLVHALLYYTIRFWVLEEKKLLSLCVSLEIQEVDFFVRI